MSSQAKAEMLYFAGNVSRTVYIGSAIVLYGVIALGYQSALSQATHPSTATMLCFTLFQIGYVVILWRLPRGKYSPLRLFLKVGCLTLLTFACHMLTVSGLGLDWQLYLVTIAAYFMVYSTRIAIISTTLLSVLSGSLMAALSHWNWPSVTANWFNLLFNFAAVAIFLAILRTLTFQRARAEQLLCQLKQSNSELEQAHQQLQHYAQEIEELTLMSERTRLAREIHDTLGHYLSLLNIQLGTMSKLYERDPADLGVEIVEARQLAEQAIHEVRNAVAALRPPNVATLSLAGALAQLGNEFTRNNEGIQLMLDLEEHLPEISQDVQMAFYRTAQEALTNVLKHAQASKVLLRLHYDNPLMELMILDDGAGAQMDRDGEQHVSGFGLTGLHERFDALEGQVTHGPNESGGGYRVTAQLRVAPALLVAGIAEASV